MPTPVADQATLRQISIDLIRSVFPLDKGIRLVGVTLSNFPGGEATQLDLMLAHQRAIV
jgi:DNA polymerase-4